MVHNYKKKKEVLSDEKIKEIRKELLNEKESIRSIGRKYNLPESTLRRRLQKLEKDEAGEEDLGTPKKKGGQTALPAESEMELATVLITMANWGFAATRDVIKLLVQQYVRTNKEKDTPAGQHISKYCKFKDDKPGEDWLVYFMKRYDLSSKKPSALEKTRKAAASDPKIIYGYFEVLEKEAARLGIEDRPEYFLNLDKTNVPMDPASTKVIVPKRIHTEAVILTTEEMESTLKEQQAEPKKKKQRSTQMKTKAINKNKARSQTPESTPPGSPVKIPETPCSSDIDDDDTDNIDIGGAACRMSSRKLHKCCECSKEFLLESNLKIHTLEHQKIEKPLRYPTEREIIKEKNKGKSCSSQSERENYVCKFCNLSFKSNACLRNHSKKHPEQREATRCMKCKHTFPSEKLLKEHSHQLSFECETCKAVLESCSDLKFHKNLHIPPENLTCNTCNKIFTAPNLLYQHKLTHTGKKCCTVCNKELKNYGALRMHKVRFHSKNRHVPCTICGKKYDKGYLKTHMEIHSERDVLECHLCGLTFNHQNYLSLHMKRHTDPKRLDCDVCGKKFLNRKNLLHHKSIHTQEKDCPFCPEILKNDQCYKKHIRKYHSDVDGERAQCHICGNMYYKPYLQTHIDIHLGKKNHKCKECGKAFASLAYLRDHLKTHSGEENYKCELCGKTVNSKASLKNHKKLHQGLKPFKCKVCFRNFARGFQLTCHMLVHSKEKLFSCQLCGKKFTHKKNIRPHYATHSPEELKKLDPSILESLSIYFECQVCGKVFHQKAQLVAHAKIHCSNPYSCSLCDRSYRLQKLLTVHMEGHKDGKSHQCHVCDKWFENSLSLKKHVRLHNKSVPHSCFVCGQVFSSKIKLDVHMKGHSHNLPESFNCNACGKFFTQKDIYIVHQKSCTSQKEMCSENNVGEIYDSTHFVTPITEETYVTETISELERNSGIDCSVSVMKSTDCVPLNLVMKPQVRYESSEEHQRTEEELLVD